MEIIQEYFIAPLSNSTQFAPLNTSTPNESARPFVLPSSGSSNSSGVRLLPLSESGGSKATDAIASTSGLHPISLLQPLTGFVCIAPTIQSKQVCVHLCDVLCVFNNIINIC